jgi:hypothetical protein
MSTTASNFYVPGGTLPQDAPSYVERQADRDLFDGLLKGEFCYVLTSRQMGKSSLMVRTSNKLRVKGVNVVSLDLTAIGQNLTPEQWYDGLVMRMGRQLRLEDELEDFWRAHERVSPVQRLMSAIRDVAMVKRPGPLVIFVDEIDTVRSLPFSTDEFFSAVRECYNHRTEDPDLNRLTFCLLGVATPSDLIRDTRTTPFNIGRRIELSDFTAGEAAPLANGLGREQKVAGALLDRILYWTNGHPYLTQRLCQAVAGDPGAASASAVDQLCETLFLSNRARERDDNLLFVRERLLRSEVDRASLLSLYDQVRNRKRIRDVESNPLISFLRLSGIVRVVKAFLEVRNRIYHRVFDQPWVQANLPDQELRRQREAFRKGLLRGAAVAAVITVVSLGLFWFGKRQLEASEARVAKENLGKAYHGLTSYQDTVKFQQEFEMEGTKVITTGTLVLSLEKPNKLNLLVKQRRGIGALDAQMISDGESLWTYRPDLKQYTLEAAPESLKALIEEAHSVGDMDLTLTLYGLLGSKDPQAALAKHAKTLKFLRKEMLDGMSMHVLSWTEELPGRIEENSSNPAAAAGRKLIPITVWLSPDDGVIRQWVTDLSNIHITTPMQNAYNGAERSVQLRNFVTTMKHSAVRLNTPVDPAMFVFQAPDDAQQVERINPAQSRAQGQVSGDLEPRYDKGRLSELIPSRSLDAPQSLIDLSSHYNAPLTEPWHSQRVGNDLAALPRGLQVLAGTQFDIRGIVQLAGRQEPYLSQVYPKKVDGIRVGLKARRLHFLQGAGWSTTDGAQIGSYVIHLGESEQRIVPIIYGFDVRNWWPQAGEPSGNTGLTLAWAGSNEAIKSQGEKLRLFKCTWLNPLPESEIQSIDYVSTMDNPAPFVIAITAEN